METNRYLITNAADLLNVGLPAYMLGMWDHYNTSIGEVRLARVSGRGQKFASIAAADFAKGVEVGLFVKVAR